MRLEKILIDIYDMISKESILEIEKISKKTGICDCKSFSSYRTVLMNSSDLIKRKWKSKRKYLRTAFVKQALGNSYPEKILKISLSVDSIINILDDLFDEKLDTVTKSLLIIEIGKLLGFLNRQEAFDKEIAKVFGGYLHKIVFMGITEKILKETLKGADGKKFFEIAVPMYSVRSMDIDFFVQIADEKLLRDARIFRVLNLIKKDVDDIHHDIESGNETPITMLYRKDKKLLKKFIEKFLKRYSRYIHSMNSGFKRMCENETKNIKKRIENI